MKKKQIALCGLIAAMAIAFASCETFIRAFAEQTGRNAADAVWGKKTAQSADAAPVKVTDYSECKGD